MAAPHPVGGELIDGTGGVPLAEDTEEYELEILGPDDEVRRTVTGLTSPPFTYTTAMQAEDFPEGYPASAFVVYEISAQAGRGFAGRFDFADAPQLVNLGESIAEGQAGGGSSNFPANTVMAQRYDGVSGQVLSASAYLGSADSGNMRDGPVRRQCGRARRSDRDHRREGRSPPPAPDTGRSSRSPRRPRRSRASSTGSPATPT